MAFEYEEDMVSLLISLGIALKFRVYTNDRLFAERLEDEIFRITTAIDEKFRKGLTTKESEEVIKFLKWLLIMR